MIIRAYSQDLRDRALKGLFSGRTSLIVAIQLDVSESWVQSVWKRFKTTGETTARKQGGCRPARLKPYREEITGWIKEKPDMTLEEMTERLFKEKAVKISISGLSQQLAKWQLTFKKNSQRSRANPPRRC